MMRRTALALLAGALFAARAAAAQYFVDSSLGSDSNAGTAAAPWKTLSAVGSRTLAPDDVVSFKRGTEYAGALELASSGSASAPIVLNAYGDGAAPLFTNPGALHAFEIRGSDVVLDGLSFADTATMPAWNARTYEGSGAVLIASGADDVLVTSCDFTRVGVGVKSYGLHTTIRGNTFHDLVIAYADKQLSYGAIGVSINSSYAQIDHNTFIRCRSTHSPYGADGGAIEIEGYANQGKDHITISHNRSSQCQGFLEVTETTSSDVKVVDNVSDDYQQFIAFDTTVTPSGYLVDHNTVVRSRGPNATNVFAVFYYREPGPAPQASWLNITNNIFYTPICKVLKGTYSFKPFDFPHSGNVFYDGGPDPVGYPLGPGDVVADPHFVDFYARDFHLSPDSPAIGKGADF